MNLTPDFQLKEIANLGVTSMLDAFEVCFYIIDTEGNYIFLNDTATKYISGVLNARIVNRIAWEDCKEVMREGERVMREEFLNDQWQLAIKQPLFDGEICIGIMVLSFEITELKNNQEKIVQFTKEEKNIFHEKASNLQLFSYYLVEELNTIISGIKNKMDVLQFSLPLLGDVAVGVKVTKARRHQLLNIIDALKSLKNTIDSSVILLDFMQTDFQLAKIGKEQFTMCSIAEILRLAIRDYPFQADEEKLLHCDWQHDFYFAGVEIYLIHVFINLLKNALSAIKAAKRGEVFVSFTEPSVFLDNQEKKFYRVIIKDTALGISRDLQDKLFLPFASDCGQTGLGLAFCKNVMQALGGDITCDSQLGKYTEFTLWFPVGGC